MTDRDLSQLSMQELFQVEAESQTNALTNGLLALERDPKASAHLDACMRAAHSLKGAARIVDIDAGVTLAHAMEDFLVAAQRGRLTLRQDHIDLLLRGVDLMIAIARTPDLEIGGSAGGRRQDIDSYVAELSRALAESSPDIEPVAAEPAPLVAPTKPSVEPEPAEVSQPVATGTSAGEASRVLRVTVENLNRLLGLAGETLVESRWRKPFGQSLARLKQSHREVAKALDSLGNALTDLDVDERALTAMTEARRGIAECQNFLTERLFELEESDRQSTTLANRLYDQALACRMRPFEDGIGGLPRMVRDVGQALGKKVRLEVIGASTQVDRDILDKLEAPLGHLLRNAIDHGIESPEERRAAGKPEEGVVLIEARHGAGALQVIVSDDGRGIDRARLREIIVERRLTNADTAGKLDENELLAFLFLPGLSLKTDVTDISGRGVGLDAVQDMARQVRGVVRVTSVPGRGTRFHLQLPLTLSVVRTLIAEINKESYAFPFAQIVRAMKMTREKIESFEGHEHFDFDGQKVGLVTAHQVFEGSALELGAGEVSVIVVGDPHNRYGLVVDRFLGGRELVVHPLDARLGKIKDISAAALMEDGSPVLIVDVEDMIRSMEKLAQANRLKKVRGEGAGPVEKSRKRILVVDDSLTVRELERKLLAQSGYDIEVAVDGMDGWNAARSGRFDLIITDIDMPRMDGIELVSQIRKDARLKSLPVMVLSYKDRDEDRRRGLEAGADYYLTKGSFHDNTLLGAVVDLIGEAMA